MCALHLTLLKFFCLNLTSPSLSAKRESEEKKRPNSDSATTSGSASRQPTKPREPKSSSLVRQGGGGSSGNASSVSGNGTSEEAVGRPELLLQATGIERAGGNVAHDGRKTAKGPAQIIDIREELKAATRLDGDQFNGIEDRLLKPLSGLGWSAEMRDLAAVISRDILTRDPNVRWSDIIGLDNARRLSKEAVVYPIRYPQLFSGILSPWKGLLLYGPPGTGKVS